MLVFPNCKINLGLQILSKREDGYHNLETVFYPVPLRDALEVIQNNSSRDIQLTTSGILVQGSSDSNLCIKAYRLLQNDIPQLPPVQMHLHKAIPMGAGLGGGSADGAFTLQLLNNKFQLGLSQSQLIQYALQLGSDCPFFILNQPCHASGRGEIMSPVQLSLAGYHLLLINPGIHINTGWAFSELAKTKPKQEAQILETIIHQPITAWKQYLVNDFENAIFPHYPEIESIKNNLYHCGALYASMSGSGSSVYGIFKNKIEIKLAEKYFSRWLLL
ncbi:MAG TPA: 4-(cytidine 5'-diphospho)-2-C-methyl-D-erythritol kinase [Ferruginibacter sp.]|nr:4-(cytidine 5'-diphospho)-2-C-methyl-D-erythritol kinase [Ferruginibacter sp.]HMP21094.1 4-(cytidine 5'-diphospho)-2-C-methyl-D-erythritol kinase [Ferruginibacter sp.]